MKTNLTWQVGYSKTYEGEPAEWYPATVPGAVQLDYAKAHGWEPFYKGTNIYDYKWMEDVYWRYRAPLDFSLARDEIATLVFHGIDYRYEIYADGDLLSKGEGMFSTVRCDVTAYADKKATLEVLLYPAPKCDDSDCRDQARKSAKACACYGWDWHPRLISAGLWDEVYLEIQPKHSIRTLEASYVLSDDLSECVITVDTDLNGEGDLCVELLDGGCVVAKDTVKGAKGRVTSTLSLSSPKLWNPVGYGEQNRYTLRATTCDEAGKPLDVKECKIGFRRVRMVMNEGAWKRPSGFPKSRSDAPATLELNGRRIFAKGSNWVNAKVFPGEMNREHYDTLLTEVKDANMNILRVWGGGFVNKESFFELCDEKGIMVWQEFPLACNEYPDEDAYLDVLKREATSIIRRVRTHPCLVLWCGGNELFNSWSRMTEQSHALRLLDSLCYELDRFTPYIMTSPLNGMGHGHYVNYDESTGEEMLTTVANSSCTAYTEFGAPAGTPPEDFAAFMSDEDYADRGPHNPAWVAHHGYEKWVLPTWVREAEAEYYFGGFTDTDDLLRKMQAVQEMTYPLLFEEMRKQWPACSMALNWCFNEPWPTVGNNSLILWPEKPRPSYYTVQRALRPRLSSLRVKKCLWWDGEDFEGEIWMLNDSSIEPLAAGSIKASYAFGNGEAIQWGTLSYSELKAQENRRCGGISFRIPTGFSGKIRIFLTVEGNEALNSEYTLLCRERRPLDKKGMLNV